MRTRACLSVAGIFLLVFVFACSARADSLTVAFDIAPFGTVQPFGPPPWGTLSLVLNPDGTISASLTMSPGQMTNLLAFNIVGGNAGITVAGLPPTYFFSTGIFTSTFGAFNGGITSFGPLGEVVDVPSLTFDISRPGGFSSVFQLAVPSNGPQSVHFMVTTTDPAYPWIHPHAGAVVPGIIPEPGSLSLLILGSLCLAIRLRQKMRS